jgi:hypothetical protein
LRFLIHFALVFVWVRDIDVVSVFYSQMFSFHSNICWTDHFSIIYFGYLCQKSGGHRYVDSYLGLLFCSIDVHACFCARTMLFWLLWLCSIVWSRGLWHLQCCSFCSVLPWLFKVFCASIWIFGLIFQSWWWMSLEFWWGLYWTRRLLWQYSHFHNIDSTNQWVWEIFPSSVVFIDFFL